MDCIFEMMMQSLKSFLLLVSLAIIYSHKSSTYLNSNWKSLWKPTSSNCCDKVEVNIKVNTLLSHIRGGEKLLKRKQKKKKAAFSGIKEVFSQVLPANRFYLILCLFCTIVHLLGLPAPALFGLDKSYLWQIWRPFTSAAYFGPPSMSMANNLFFLIRYGQMLESSNGTGSHAWFLLVETALLTVLGLLLGFPFLAQAMVAAIIYTSSRVNAMEKMPFQFGLVITSWQLPFCMMIIDCLSQQSASAAWPHVLGIFCGHVYHFFTEVWPALGGRPRLQPPQWILDKFGGPPTSNIKGFNLRKKTGSKVGGGGNGGILSKVIGKKRSKGRKLT